MKFASPLRYPGGKAEQIHVSDMDARRFPAEKLPRGRGRARVFVYLGPPYWNKGSRLYLNACLSKNHRALARYMQGQKTLKWIVSCDDTTQVRNMYAWATVRRLSLRYHLQGARDAQELLIAPDHLQLPGQDRRNGAQAWTTT